jgi:hypothetical protein
MFLGISKEYTQFHAHWIHMFILFKAAIANLCPHW